MKAEQRLSRPSTRRGHPAFAVVALGVLLLACNYLSDYRIQVVRKASADDFQPNPKACSPPLPTLLTSKPPTLANPHIKTAAASLHALFAERANAPDIDSLSVAVVTPSALLFQGNYGVLRANETIESRGVVTGDSIYRIASITKMFTTLETLILRERGYLNWDDPVTKFIPNFTNPSSGWATHLSDTGKPAVDQAPVTLRQLASHLSGIGRDYPPYDVGSWPATLAKPDPSDEYDNRMNGSLDRLLDAVAHIPLVAPQYTFPIYSNTGFDLLGACNTAAYELATGEPITHRELLHKDVFDPLKMTSSFYKIPNSRLAAQVAVPATDSEWADLTYSNTFDPAGGQYSSLNDLAMIMQTFLAPENGAMGSGEVGAPWEIKKISDSARVYSKGGNLPGYHSQFALNPQWGYGVIVLVTGTYTDTETLTRQAIERFQPAFELALLDEVRSAYTGIWFGNDSVALVTLDKGVLYLQTLLVGDQDVLGLLQRDPVAGSQPIALWTTGRPDEFRLAIGRPELNGNPDAGCEPYWLSFDWPTARGAPLDLIFWEHDELVYPSAGVRLRRARE
ncbi:Beta-lactamase domain-containing protein [Mycena chlorophos]|uniref:Beta-lactamase domain-containing protein n=1 Tax=Mycena chlorophos TaxID=658473 RepID=A0A8H6T2U9_MYCCL|nr:Beta-lactamase domain-containing protein [Mycena chlorophos]